MSLDPEMIARLQGQPSELEQRAVLRQELLDLKERIAAEYRRLGQVQSQRRFEAACAAMEQDCQGQWNVNVSDETLAMRAKFYVRLADALLAALSAQPITEVK